ncbi:alpha/beta fold hydrolase [Risungbinella massiliensis]|uniref:alpha/beta fold hydrolase n=1 Tax=Risungbinella massiliensis TaxID=1329796 RepID=UPI0005CBB87E|nr:alpha/beta hydrolase [Risungbinella massiliensis]
MYFKKKDTQLYYEVVGNGEPLLVLHGFAVDHRILFNTIENVLKHSAKEYRRIYIDLPGMGKSPAPSNIHNADELLELLISFIDEVIGKEKFSVIGNSYGGYLSIGITKKLSHQVNRLVLLAPVIVADFQKRKLPQKKVAVREEIDYSGNEIAFEDYESMAVNITKNSFIRYLEEIYPALQIAQFDYLNNYQSNGYQFSFESILFDSTYTTEVLMVLGKQDNVVGFEDALSIQDSLPNIQTVILENAGHNLQLDQPDKVEKEIQSFLN